MQGYNSVDVKIQDSKFKQSKDCSVLLGISDSINNKMIKGDDWKDFVYRYSSKVDILKLYFVQASSGIIEESENITDNIIVDYDEKGMMVALEILNASSIIPCHFDDTQEIVGKKAPFVLSCEYSPDVDYLKIYFVTSEYRIGSIYASDNITSNIIIDQDKNDCILGFEIINASWAIRKRAVT